MKKTLFIVPFILMLFGCTKKTSAKITTKNNKTTITAKTTKRTTNKTTDKKTTTSKVTREETQIIKVNLDFNEGTVKNNPEKYLQPQYVRRINKTIFPTDIKNKLMTFKGWTLNGELIFNEKLEKVNDFEITDELTFKAKFSEHPDLTNFVYDVYGTDQNPEIWIMGYKNKKEKNIYIPEYVYDGDTKCMVYQFITPLEGCNKVEKLELPFIDFNLDDDNIWKYGFGFLFGTKEMSNSYEIAQYYFDGSEYHEVTYYIPESLKQVKLNGTNFGDRLFANFIEVKDIDFILTTNFSSVSGSAFYGIEELGNIYFEGTAEEFALIDVDDDALEVWNSATVYFYSEEEPEESDKYWYYDDSGEIIIWHFDEPDEG